jgi:hypothetical protein
MGSREQTLYWELSRPRRKEEVNAGLAALRADLEAVREKHGVPDMICVVGVNVLYDGGVGAARNMVRLGNPVEVEELLAWALGYVQAERRERINRYLAGTDVEVKP